MPLRPRGVRLTAALCLGTLMPMALALAAAQAPEVPDEGTTEVGPAADLTRPSTHGCPKLDSQLFQLTRVADPVAFAAGSGLDLRDDGVRVIVELVDPAIVPQGYGLRAEASYANLLRARVPLEQLCTLSNDEVVVFVRPRSLASSLSSTAGTPSPG